MGSWADPIRVASVPGRHAYVEHLNLGGSGIEVLPDPAPPGAPPGRWWPPVMLDADWIDRHADTFDVLHLHFGAESLSIAALSDALDALERAGRPLIYTAHDLVNPQLSDQTPHLRQLELLMKRASEVITLTPGAAREIGARWGRNATVIAHPRMLEGSARMPLCARHPSFTVGVHLRDLRPNIDGPGTVRTLADALAILDDEGYEVRGRVTLFPAVRDPEARAAVLRSVAASTLLTAVQAPRARHDALIEDLCRLDVSLLPYRHGTHSGWAELCWDLGLPAVGAAVGFIAQQHDETDWFSAVDLMDPLSLAGTLRRFVTRSVREGRAPSGEPRPDVIRERRQRRDQDAPGLSAAHRRIYDGARR